jgi:divalent metal cation (Fe/Co/Zn/Cd) transporter
VTTIQLQRRLPSLPPQERLALERRARLLAWGGNAWHVVEFGVAIVAGVVAASPALIGFSLDSLIELAAGFVIVWLYRLRSGHADERRAQQFVAATYLLLVVFIVAESFATLLGDRRPEVSWVGIGLAAFTTATMPLLARAKRRVGHTLGSSATVSEAAQSQICAYLSIALLAGLLANALAGWWWADPAAALAIAALAAKEGLDSWHGKSCDCC